ncbi:CAP domain-containing protein [Qipengyuania qiaonensis]|nr:CAP domain-containing protein [Qipengyuania qiaonensis]
MALLCATGSGVAASGSSQSISTSGAYPERYSAGSGAADIRLAASVLGTHNNERMRLSLEPLKWNVHLEQEAKQWAEVLSRRGSLQHADRATRNGTGENLWMGTAGNWPVERMVGMFIDEKKHYRHASFPDISRTGSWSDVGHYTQVIWRDTKEVGCAVATARGNDVLVCRYWPAGNIWGQKAY